MARDLLNGGSIKTFVQIFDAAKKSNVYKDLGMNYYSFESKLKQTDLFSLRELKEIAKLLGVDAKLLIDLAYKDSLLPKKKA